MTDKIVGLVGRASGGKIAARREEPDELVFNMEDGVGESPLKSALLQHPSVAHGSKMD
jgi:hypothetical protein